MHTHTHTFAPQVLQDVVIHALGRSVHPTANGGRLRGSHSIRLWDLETKSLLASLIVDEDSQRDDFGYAFGTLLDSIRIRKNRNYILTTEEQSGGGDPWCDQGPRTKTSLNIPIKILYDCSGVPGDVFPNQGSKNTTNAAMGVPSLYTFPIISSCSNYPCFETCTSSSRFDILDSGRTLTYAPRQKGDKEEEEEEEKKNEEIEEEEEEKKREDIEGKETKKWDIAMCSSALKRDGVIHRWCVIVEECPIVAIGVLNALECVPPSKSSSLKNSSQRRDHVWAEKNLDTFWMHGFFVVLSRDTIVGVIGEENKGEDEAKQFTQSRLTSLASIARASKSKVVVDMENERINKFTYALELDAESGILKISVNGGPSKDIHCTKLRQSSNILYPAVAFQSCTENATKTKEDDAKDEDGEKKEDDDGEEGKYRVSICGAGLNSNTTVEMHSLHKMTRIMASLAGTMCASMIEGSEVSSEERELIPWILSPAFSGGIVDGEEIDSGGRFVKFANEEKDYKILTDWITRYRPLKRSEKKVKFLKLERAVMAVLLKHSESGLRNEVLQRCRSKDVDHDEDDGVKPSKRLLNMWKKIRDLRKWLRKQKQIFRSREFDRQNQALENKNIPEPPEKLIRINSNESRRGHLSRRMRMERPNTFEELQKAILNRCEFLLRDVRESAVDFGASNSTSSVVSSSDTVEGGLKPPSPLRRQRSFDGVMSVRALSLYNFYIILIHIQTHRYFNKHKNYDEVEAWEKRQKDENVQIRLQQQRVMMKSHLARANYSKF